MVMLLILVLLLGSVEGCAWSNFDSRLVAAITTTPSLVSKPSISTSSWFRVLEDPVSNVLFRACANLCVSEC